jgi:hypothetical protein
LGAASALPLRAFDGFALTIFSLPKGLNLARVI